MVYVASFIVSTLHQCQYSKVYYIKCKIFGVTNVRTKTCPKIYLYELSYCPKICHAENFLTDMRMFSVDSITTTGTETRNVKSESLSWQIIVNMQSFEKNLCFKSCVILISRKK